MIDKQLYQSAFRKLSFMERVYVGRPDRVVMVAKIHGRISDQEIDSSLKKILAKYPIIGAHLELDNDGCCWLVPADLSKLPVTILQEENAGHWMQIAQEEQRYPFNLETGPLLHFTLMRSGDKTTLIVNCHHSICDGLSVCFLLSDVLHFIAEPDSEIGTISDPTLNLNQIIPLKSTGNILRRIGIWAYNRKWKKNGVSFNFQDYRRLLNEIWRVDHSNRIAVVDLESDELQMLIQNCKQNQVTVNTALVTAMLAVQQEQRGDSEINSKVAIPVNIRERYNVKAEKTFGFFALLEEVEYRYDKTLGFWENARKAQQTIALKLSDQTLNRSVQLRGRISPFLVDSLFFAKYGLLNNSISNGILKKAGFAGTSTLGITNLGAVKIPETYGHLKIDAIYGPCVFTDLAEKLVGITTINNKLTISVTYHEQIIDSSEAAQFLKATIRYLTCSAAEI